MSQSKNQRQNARPLQQKESHEPFSRRQFLNQAALGAAAVGTLGIAGCGGGGGNVGLDPGVNKPGDGQGIGEIPQPQSGGPRSVIVTPADLDTQEAYYFSGDLYTFLATAEQTNGLFTAFEFLAPPGGGPRPHIHTREAETFFVFSGDFTEIVNQTGVPIDIGATLYGALGQPHAFKNTGNTYGRILSIAHPSGLEQLFRSAGRRVTNRNAPIPDETEQQLQQIVEVSLHRGDQPFRPEDVPPTDPRLLDRVLAEPATPIDPRLNSIHGVKGYLYAQRPPFEGPFGLRGKNLISFGETNNTLSFNRISIAPQTAMPTAIANADDQIYYPVSGTMALQLEGQRTTIAPNTFIYIRKGDRYAIANLGNTPVDLLSVRLRPGSNLKTRGEPAPPTVER